MPRVTVVKKAQQRYAVKPTIDPATGQQKIVPMINSRTGEQKVTKHGKPVVLRVTERDYTQPLPMPTCDYCRETIAVGTSYKWIEPSGQRVRNRHATCPTWNVWEYSSSLSARVAQIAAEPIGDFESVEDVTPYLEERAQEIRDLAAEKQESADNMEEGFGHSTSQSEELADIANQLESWADDVENTDLPEYPEAEEQDCATCDATGTRDEEDCPMCEGTGQYTPEEPTDEQLEEWRAAIVDAVESVMGECPV